MDGLCFLAEMERFERIKINSKNKNNFQLRHDIDTLNRPKIKPLARLQGIREHIILQ